MKSKYMKKLISSLIFSGFGIFTLLFFAPAEVYLGNPSEFRFSLDAAVGILAVTALLITVIFSLLISLLPVKVLKFVNLGILGATLCFYLQFLLLNDAMIAMDGNSLILSRGTKLLNAIIWLVVFASVYIAWFVFKKLGKEKAYITATKYLAIALTVMQLTGFCSLFFTYDRSVNDAKNLYFSTEGRFEVSKNNNVIYFIIDYCDSTIVAEALQEDPELFNGLDGFTYYPDNVFTHARTFPAISYLLTSHKYLNDIPPQTYIDNAFQNNEFLGRIDDTGADIRLYTDPRYIGNHAMPYVDNMKTKDSAGFGKIRLGEFLRESVTVSGYRGAPYVMKRFFEYMAESINRTVIISEADQTQLDNDFELYDAIRNTKLSVNENYDSAFRFYHMFGSHPGATFNENMEYEENVSLPRALRGDMKIIKEYIQQLKDLGVYDETTIIITADHGEFLGYFLLPPSCLLLVKEAGADSSVPIRTSKAQICHEDLFATALKAMGADYADFGPAIDEIPEDINRHRYHYNMEVDKGHEAGLFEYLVIGESSNLNYIVETQHWDVKYSFYN